MNKKDGGLFIAYLCYSIILSIYTLAFWIISGKLTGGYFGYSIGWIGWISLIMAVILLSLSLLILIIKRNWIHQIKFTIQGIKKFFIYSLLILSCLFSIYISIYIQQDKIGNSISRIWLISETVLFCVVIMKYAFGIHFLPAFSMSFLFIGIVYAFIDQISTISNYPFSLAWSEGSRYYNASLLFSQKLYGRQLALAFIDPARSVLQAIPYAIGLRSILIQRLWQSFLWLGFPAIASYSVVRRYYRKIDIVFALTLVFIFLVLLSAPVYFFLLLCIIPLMLWIDQRKPWRTLLLVLITSLWAGICRVNWFAVPAGLSVFLYLLEVPPENKRLVKYLIWPFIWGLAGIAFALLSSQIYILISGTAMSAFNTAMHSTLLWYRLFPNSTYGLGILISTVLFFIPLYLIADTPSIYYQLKSMRFILVSLILFVFLTAGLIISIKVGAGSNLHELDAFIIFSLVVIAYGYFKTGMISNQPSNPILLASLGISLACIITVTTIAISVTTPIKYNQAGINGEIGELKALLNKYGKNPLFLSDRQLLSSGEINIKEFEPGFEGFTLMEMVMSNDIPYLNQFSSDLKQHTFSMIITKPINSKIQDRNAKFSKENNLWVKKVEMPVLESYKLVAELPLSQTEIYIPK